MVRAPRGWWRPALLATLVGVVVVEWGSVVASRDRDREAEVVTQRLTDRLATCILGEAARDAGDGPEPRLLLAVRAAQLVAMGLPADRRQTSPEPPWPSRCGSSALALASDETRRGSLARARSAARLGAALSAPDGATADWSGPLGAWLADVRQAGRSVHRVDDAPLPPGTGAASATTVDSLEPGSRLLPGTVPLAAIHFDRTFDESASFVVDQPSSSGAGPSVPAYCVYAAREARCVAMRGAAAGAGPVVPAGASVVLAGDAGAGGVFEVGSGARIPVELPDGVYGVSTATTGDGLDLLTTTPFPAEIHWVHVEGHGAAAKTTDTPVLTRGQAGDPSFNVGLFWGFLVAKRVAPEASGLRLRVRKLTGREIGPEVDVGQVGEAPALEASGAESHLQACRSQGSIALGVHAWDSEYFSFFEPRTGAWSHPVELDDARGAMTCRGAEVTLLDQRGHVEGHRFQPVITESRCTPAACRTASLRTRDVFAGNADVTPQEPRDVHVAAVDDQVLLVFRAGDLGGLRMRLGKLEDLAGNEDVVLFDDHLEGGKLRQDSTLLDFMVRPVPGGALLLLATTAGTFVYRVDAAGAFLPVRMAFH